MEAGFELFDHTADMGLSIRAPDRAALLWPAAQALYAAIGELVPGAASREQTVACEANEPAVLLRDFLDELLVLFDQDRRIANQIIVEQFDDHLLRARVLTVKLDEKRSILEREVKAVTYHELYIKEVQGGLEATIIVDI